MLIRKPIAQTQNIDMQNTLENTTEKFPSESNYSIEWEEIENTDLDYEYDLDEIENFFKEDCNNDIIDL